MIHRNAIAVTGALLLVAAFANGGCETPGSETGKFVGEDIAQQILALHQRSAARLLPDDGDLRPAARKILEQLRRSSTVPPALPQGLNYAVTLPPTIRLWRRSLGGSDSCKGKIDVIPLERYVKGVLPHEWISSWKVESLRAGAIAIRSYASSWVKKGGKYTCADLCDTTRSQVYKDATKQVTNDAVDATAGVVLVKAGAIVFAEYSAENGDPTKYNVADPPCAGKALFGHGRGMCQWGSQRWATQGKDHKWIALHYYPGATLFTATGPLPADSGPPPADSGTTPPSDSAVSDAPASLADSAMISPDAGVPFSDIGNGTWPDHGTVSPLANNTLSGGCGVSAAPRSLLISAFAFLLVVFCRRRRR